MTTSPLHFFRRLAGLGLFLLFSLISLPLGSLVIVGWLIHWLVPFRRYRLEARRMVQNISSWWIACSNVILKLLPTQWHISGPKESLSKAQWYLVIANHQTWLDILVLGFVFNQYIPPLKFFMKKSLLWLLPILGLACWVLGYPFITRYNRNKIRKMPQLKYKNREAVKKACQTFKLFPGSIVNFVEGGRFNPEKHLAQKSSFRHLLPPHAGGIAVTIDALQNYLSAIIDVTIYYSDPHVSLFNFFISGCKRVEVRYTVIPLSSDLIGDYYCDRLFRHHFQNWLDVLWQEKDIALNQLQSICRKNPH